MTFVRICILTIFLLVYCSVFPLNSSNDETEELKALYEEAGEYFMAEEYPEALNMYLRCLRMADKIDDYKMKRSCLGNIGLIFGIVRDYEQAIQYTRQTYDLAKKHKDYEVERKSACVLVEQFLMIDELDSAVYYNNIQKGVETHDFQEGNFLSLYNDGLIARARNDYTMTIYYFTKALEYARTHELPDKYEIQILTELGQTMMEEGETDAAYQYLTEAERKALELDSPNMLIGIYRIMIEFYKITSQPQLSEDYRLKYISLSDSLIDRVRFNAAKNSLYEYESHINSQRISGLNRQIKNYLTTIISAVILLIILLVFSIVIVRKNRKLTAAQRVIIEKNDELQAQNVRNNELRNKYLNAVEQIPEEKKERYKAGISDKDVDLMVKKITEVFEDTETISNPAFNLNMLVTKVESNNTYVSWVINEIYGKSFKSLLNEYRVREAARRLTDTEKYGNLTIQAVYETVGYNSASNFIKAFKTVMGMTPSAYQKLQTKP